MNNQSYVISSLAQEQAKNKELTDRNETLQNTIESLRKEAKKNESSGHNPANKQN